MFYKRCMLSRKNPALLESVKILTFYAILPSTPLIACESFIQALLWIRKVCVSLGTTLASMA
jgi:hypothetical protein